MTKGFGEFVCTEHGDLSHAYVHDAGIAVAATKVAMAYDSVSIPSMTAWVKSIEEGNVGGFRFGSNSLWGHAKTQHHAGLALAFVLAGALAEHTLFGHSIGNVQVRDLEAWLRALGDTEHFTTERVEHWTGVPLNDTAIRVHQFVRDRQAIVLSVANAFAIEPDHTLAYSEVMATIHAALPEQGRCQSGLR
jgi:hypothetical protein